VNERMIGVKLIGNDVVRKYRSIIQGAFRVTKELTQVGIPRFVVFAPKY
jgi:hypothetical protein